jgi:hypothetical protein
VEWEDVLPSDLPEDLGVPNEAVGSPTWLRCFDAAVVAESLRGSVTIRYAVLRDERGVRAVMPVHRVEQTDRGHIFRIDSAMFDWISAELESPIPARRIGARLTDLLVRGAGLHSHAPLVAAIPGPGFVGSPARRPDVGPDELAVLCSALVERARAEKRWLMIPGLNSYDPWSAVVAASDMRISRWWSCVDLQVAPPATDVWQPAATRMSGSKRHDYRRRLRKFQEWASAEGVTVTWSADWAKWAGRMHQLNETWAKHTGHHNAVLQSERGFVRMSEAGISRCLLVHRGEELLAFVLNGVRDNIGTTILGCATPAFLDRDPTEASLLLIAFTLAPMFLAREGITTVRLGYGGIKGKTSRGGVETVSSLAVLAGIRPRAALAAPAYLVQEVMDAAQNADDVGEGQTRHQRLVRRLVQVLARKEGGKGNSQDSGKNKIASNSGDKTGDKSGNKTGDKSGNKTGDKSGNKTGNKVSDESGNMVGDESSDKSGNGRNR